MSCVEKDDLVTSESPSGGMCAWCGPARVRISANISAGGVASPGVSMARANTTVAVWATMVLSASFGELKHKTPTTE